MHIAEAFLKRVETDRTLQTELDAVGWHSSAAVAIAQGAGFAVTAAELETACTVLYGQLSDSALQSLAGGMGNNTPRPNIIIQD